MSKNSPPPQHDFRRKTVNDFSSFTFEVKSNKEKYESVENNKSRDRDIFNTMEFTHQNLNKDFLTGDFGNNKKDQFADFMSIVD